MLYHFSTNSILYIQKRLAKSFQPQLSDESEASYRMRTSQGLPLLRAEEIRVDERLYSRARQEIWRIIHAKNEDEALSPAGINDIDNGDRRTLYLKAILEDGDGLLLEKLAQEAGIPYDIFSFYIAQIFSPFILKYAEKLRPYLNTDEWSGNSCPICGREPLISRIENESGKKWLSCSLCFMEWKFKRIGCPFCENEDQELLRYFFVENDEAYWAAHRVDVCEKCKRYIKTVDARKMYQVKNLFVEYLSTLPLDFVAIKEGYQSVYYLLFSD